MRATMSRTNAQTKHHGTRATWALILTTVTAAVGCSSGGSDDAAKFAGPWTFESGQLAATCPAIITAPDPFPLAGLGVSITKVNGGSFELSAGSTGKCKVRFNVSGSKATAVTNPPQSCILEVGSFGEQTLGVTAWTLEVDGDRLKSTTMGTVLVCSLSGSGVLVRGAPDGGVRFDGGGDASDASDAPKVDAGPGPDALPDVAPTDATAGDAADAVGDADDATGG
jgi:hypothetical protein